MHILHNAKIIIIFNIQTFRLIYSTIKPKLVNRHANLQPRNGHFSKKCAERVAGTKKFLYLHHRTISESRIMIATTTYTDRCRGMLRDMTMGMMCMCNRFRRV